MPGRGRGNPFKPLDLTGQRFGRLIALKPAVLQDGKSTWWECRCDCGTTRRARAARLRWGDTQSCGCLAKDTTAAMSRRHGMSGRPEFYIWSSMRQRCTNKNTKSFKDYGGRGIRVCDRWNEKDGRGFANFFADMGPRPSPQASLDRINNMGNYEPSNCRWVTKTIQCRNRRSNTLIELDGVSKSLAEWCEKYSIKYAVACLRLRRGWTAKDAFTRPVTKSRHKGARCNGFLAY